MSIYTEIILDYYRNPKNKGELEKPDIKSKDSNPICGDIIEIQIKLDKDYVKFARFNGKGCAISQASASMLMELIEGKRLLEIKDISKEKVLQLIGIELSPLRLKCALLPLKALKLGVYSYLGEKLED